MDDEGAAGVEAAHDTVGRTADCFPTMSWVYTLPKAPKYQLLIRYLLYILAGAVLLGTILDAVSNALSIVTLPVAVTGTVLIATALAVSILIMRRRPLRWVVKGGKEIYIRKLGVQPILGAVGMIVLLWVAQYINGITKKDVKLDNVHGLLTPATDLNPPNNCDSRGLVPANALRLYFGDSVAWITDRRDEFTAITTREEKLVVMHRYTGGISVDATIRSDDGKIVAKIKNNEFRINTNNYFYSERPDAHTLIVVDQKDREVLRVRYLNPNAIKITGRFERPGRPPSILGDNGLLSNGILIGGNCIGDSGGGFIIN